MAAIDYDFTMDGTPCKGATVYFHSNGLPASKFIWRFGDGGSSVDTAPSHIYIVSDSFLVTLSVNGGKDVQKKIFIGAGLNFTMTGSPIIGDTIKFKINATMPAGSTYSWNFGDGTFSTAQAPYHIFLKSGTFEITLVVNGEVANTIRQTITVP